VRGIVAVTAAVVLLLAGGAVALVRTSSNPRDNNGGHLPVAGIVLDGFASSEKIDLSSFRGRPLVINYWASWCGFCIAEMPGFQKSYERVGRDVAFLGVDIQDQLDPAQTLRKQTGVRYPLASDRSGRVFRRLGGGLGMPTTFFVDRRGIVIQRYVGPLTQSQLDARLHKLFGV
jgi:thiol-disulfide isomerase/thioredoxin